ncbi:MAG: hypothetical protein AAGK23_09745 [Pseudomonadota bacterium]
MRISLGTVSLLTHIRLLFLFAVAFVLLAAGLSLYLRASSKMPELTVISPKLAVYRADAAAYDTVVIGTSRTLYHVIPEILEAGMAAEGCRAPKVFNFGVHGLTGAEQDWLIDEILSIGADHLKHIILEDPLPEARDIANVTSERGRYFHGPSLWPASLASIQSFPESLPKRFFRTGIFLYGVGYDLSGVGRAAATAFPDQTEGVDATEAFRIEDGFEALDELDVPDILARRQDFLDNPQKFTDALALYANGVSPNLPARAAYMERKLRELEARGLQASLYVSPDPLELDRTPQVAEMLRKQAPDLQILNYNQPDKYPALFERAIWHDFSHVTRAGATRLSETMGRDLCAASTPIEERTANAVR